MRKNPSINNVTRHAVMSASEHTQTKPPFADLAIYPGILDHAQAIMVRSTRRLGSTAIELLCILAALSCSGLWTNIDATGEAIQEAMAHWAIFGGIWVLIGQRIDSRFSSPSTRPPISPGRITVAWTSTWAIASLLAISVLPPGQPNLWLVLFAGLGFLIFVRLLASTSAPTDHLRAIIIGSNNSARALSTPRGSVEPIDFVGFVPFSNENPQKMPHLTRLGNSGSLAEILQENEIDIAFVSPSADAITDEVHQSIDTCDGLKLQTQYFPSFLDLDDMHVGMTWSAQQPGLNVQVMTDSSLSTICKRAIDVTGTVLGIVALLPVIVVCALAVKLTSRGPILYRQTRIGKSGRSFGCLKFRTMMVGAHAQQDQLRTENEQDGPAFKILDDPRITPIGRVLRKFSIDELPQLLNVLLGDMSLVGPRPPTPSEVDQYTWWQRRRISVKPGLTCVWQVYGRNRVSFKRWVEMDLYYIDNWTLWMDFKLIIHTIRVVLSGTGM